MLMWSSPGPPCTATRVGRSTTSSPSGSSDGPDASNHSRMSPRSSNNKTSTDQQPRTRPPPAAHATSTIGARLAVARPGCFRERSRKLVPAAAGASRYPGQDQQDDAHGDRDVPADVMVAQPVGGMAGEERGQ